VGDQESVGTLRGWIKQSQSSVNSSTGQGFDVIVDDGGHNTAQQLSSFMMLFQHALKPGGLYVIEDLHAGRYYLVCRQLSVTNS
jgi:predicted methyltransferase